jgi:hypothetical protein
LPQPGAQQSLQESQVSPASHTLLPQTELVAAHWMPSPVNPALHAHVREPGVFVHVALTLHPPYPPPVF